MQRIRIGLTGLACVFLLVLIGSASLPPTRSQLAATKGAAPEEPLAQLGIAPGSTAAGASTAKPVQTPPVIIIPQNPGRN